MDEFRNRAFGIQATQVKNSAGPLVGILFEAHGFLTLLWKHYVSIFKRGGLACAVEALPTIKHHQENKTACQRCPLVKTQGRQPRLRKQNYCPSQNQTHDTSRKPGVYEAKGF